MRQGLIWILLVVGQVGQVILPAIAGVFLYAARVPV